MKPTPSLIDRLLTRLIRFIYRLISTHPTAVPTGVPSIRDPSAPCPAYSPRDRQAGDFSDCRGDGHYLCRECCHYRYRSDNFLNFTVVVCSSCSEESHELQECSECEKLNCPDCLSVQWDYLEGMICRRCQLQLNKTKGPSNA